MRTHPNKGDDEDRRLLRAGILKGVFIAVLTILIFLLAQSMVHHRFFRGGRMTPNGNISQ
jgi:hypothetical protein